MTEERPEEATSSSSISSASSPNFEFQFNDDTCKFYVCVYHAREFHAFRQEVVREGADEESLELTCDRA